MYKSLATIKSPLGEDIKIDNINVNKLSSEFGITIADSGIPSINTSFNANIALCITIFNIYLSHFLAQC